MSLLDVDHGLESSNEWGQFVDIEATAEAKASRQSRFLSLFCFYNNGTNNTQKRRQGQTQTHGQGQAGGADLKETSKQEPIEQPHEDSDFEEVDDTYDSDSCESESESEEELSDTEEAIHSDARYPITSQACSSSKQKNASTIMKKLYRSVSMTKSKRSTVILPEIVLQESLESKQNAREEQDSTLNPIELVSKKCTKDEPQCGACTCVSCAPNSVQVPTCEAPQVAGRMLDIATDNQRKISLSLSEAADILVALHPKASKDQNVARKLKIQFQTADESKQKQVVARLPREKLISLLSTIRAQT